MLRNLVRMGTGVALLAGLTFCAWAADPPVTGGDKLVAGAAKPAPAPGEHVIELKDGMRLLYGGELRVRAEHFDRDAYQGQNRRVPPAAAENGPAVEYLRTRLRLWGKLELSGDNFFYARIGNRIQYFSSRPGAGPGVDSPNNGDGPSSTWERKGWTFPDEYYLDNLYWNIGTQTDNLGYWKAKLGRQDLILGNGMLVCDASALDGSRSGYMDGVVLTWQQEKDAAKSADTLTLLALYQKAQDWMPVINDRDRFISWGDTFLTGPYYTHRWNKYANMDLYYLYTSMTNGDYEDPRDDGIKRQTANLSTPGVRLFGSLHPQVDYSVEYAHQFGSFRPDVGASSADAAGQIVDARLILKAPAGTLWSPILTLEYTYLSGNDPSSGDTFEGWHPLLSGAPIWGSELFPQSGLGSPYYWTNLHQLRPALDLKFSEKLAGTLACAVMEADQPELGTGGGRNIGEELYGQLTYKLFPWWELSTQAAYFYSGDYYADGHSCEWIRFQSVVKF